MKRKSMACLIAIMIIASIVMIAGCGNAMQITEPAVGYVPQDWNKTEGSVKYTDSVDGCGVEITYGDIPLELQGREDDVDALIANAIERYSAFYFEINETGTMNIAGQLGGYAKRCDKYNVCYLLIDFITGGTCINIFAVYDATPEDESQVMSLIHSISIPDAMQITEPAVGYVPQDWNKTEGSVTYTDSVDGCIVEITYGDIPLELQGREDDVDALIQRLIETTANPAGETGTMNIAGQQAGYIKGCDPEFNVCYLLIDFITGGTYINILALYGATPEDESQVMSLIHSISIPGTSIPGFKATFAITGILAVTYLLRRRK